jgi:CheY-like chemotaxis protein
MARTVLIVDDSKVARMLITKTLVKMHPDWTLVEAGDAMEALAITGTQTVDIALIDLNMPGAGGLALTNDLRRKSPNMPIAVVTANVQEEMIARVRECGATFVAKPLTQDALAAFLSGANLRLRGAGKSART